MTFAFYSLAEPSTVRNIALPAWLLLFGLSSWVVADDVATKKVVYKQAGDTALEMTLHFPPGWKAQDQRPAIVFFFGGGWTGGKVEQFEDQAKYLASLGMVAARADYRVKSRHNVTPDACVSDAQDAVTYLAQHAQELGIDTKKMVASGGSAGGHLAACTGLTPAMNGDEAKLPRPVAMVLFNPVVNFAGEPRLMARLNDDKELAHKLSPVAYVQKDSPPALLLYGTADKLLAQGEEYVAAAKKAGCRAELFTAEGQGHGFFNRDPWKQRTLRRADEFLGSLGLLEGPPTLEKE